MKKISLSTSSFVLGFVNAKWNKNKKCAKTYTQLIKLGAVFKTLRRFSKLSQFKDHNPNDLMS